MMQLYDYFRSSAAFRVRIALNLKQLSYESIPIHLLKAGGEQHSAKYRAINPQGLVPTLVDNGHVITQSLAILAYLDACYPMQPIFPSDPVLRAQSEAVALSIACDMHPLTNRRVMQYLEKHLNCNETQQNEWRQHWMKTGFDALEIQLQASASLGLFAFGDFPTVADIFLIPHMASAHRFHVDLTPYLRLRSIEAACLSLPAFIDALPQHQPDAE